MDGSYIPEDTYLIGIYIFTYSYTSISNFTLNLLEDSGWYRVNYTAVELLFNYELLWGKGESYSHDSSCIFNF